MRSQLRSSLLNPLFCVLGLCWIIMPLVSAQTAPPSNQSSADSSASLAGPGSPESSSAEARPQSDSYILQTNDFIRIAVFQEDDLLTETRVSKAGYITFPLIGQVFLKDKTVAEAISEITARLDKDYIIHPHVTLTILDYAPQWVTVLGEVQKPGQVEIPAQGGLDLLGAVALAGGYTRVADPSHIIVRRTLDGHDQVLRVNARELARDARVSQFLLQPGDRISVAESFF